MTLAPPNRLETDIRRVAILFAGGPAPAANAVISSAANAFLAHGIEVIGIKHGYSNLVNFEPGQELVKDRDYIVLEAKMMEGLRNKQGIVIGTARANPGKMISNPAHLTEPERIAPLKSVHAALCSLEVDALISIGGDDTLKTANKFLRFQEHLPEDAKRIPVVHLPKTIDNDYLGIDFTFGYFTAVHTLASEIHNLLNDAEATKSYFLTETMGRSAGWLAYGAAIAGEASLVISVEDIAGNYEGVEETCDPESGERGQRKVMNMEQVVKRIVGTMCQREQKYGKEYGVIVIAEGLAEFLPSSYLQNVDRDEHGHIAISKVNLSRIFAPLVEEEYKRQTGKKRKINGLQLGYEARCAAPHAFDVMLGSQLGVGAYRALVENKLSGVMVSISGQLDLHYVEFEKLVDPETLVTVVRYVKPGSDFHQLARFLEIPVHEAPTEQAEMMVSSHS